MALLLCLAAGFALYFVIASRYVEPFTTTVYKGPLGADTLNGAEAFTKLKYEWKHPLMSPVTAGATALFALLPGVDRSQAIVGGVALLAAANLAMCALVLRRLLMDPTAALLGTALYALLFANLNVLAVTDSYAVSSLAVWLFLLAWLQRPAPDAVPPWTRLGPLTGVAGLCNLPLLTLAGLPAMGLALFGRWRQAALAGLATGAVGLAGTLAVVLTQSTLKWGTPWAFFARSVDYTDRYADLAPGASLAYLLDVASCFLLFAVASPVDVVPSNGLTAAAAAGYLEGAGGLLGLAALVLVLGGATASLVGRFARTALPLAGWMAVLAAFYALFNPADALLYATQAQGVLAVLACLGFAAHARSGRALWLLLGAAVLLLALRNLPIVLLAPYGFDFRFAPHRALLLG